MNTALLDLAELDVPEIEAVLEQRRVPRFHARQLFRWIYKRGVTDIDLMTDLSRALRTRLASEFVVSSPRILGDER